MKKIINGKKYDTETANIIAGSSHGCASDINFWSETLYRKTNGEYFLYGEGGPASKYREYSASNSFRGGENITPLTEYEAKSWAERNMTVEKYEDEFGEVEE